MSDRPIDLPPFEPRRKRSCPRPGTSSLDGQPIHTTPARRPVVRRAYEDGTRHTTQTALLPFEDLKPLRRRPSSPRVGAFWAFMSLAAAVGSLLLILGLAYVFAVLWLSVGRGLP